jgi:hypothetical protein
MLAAVVLISEIEFEEDNRGAAQIKGVAPFAHGKYLEVNTWLLVAIMRY